MKVKVQTSPTPTDTKKDNGSADNYIKMQNMVTYYDGASLCSLGGRSEARDPTGLVTHLTSIRTRTGCGFDSHRVTHTGVLNTLMVETP